MKESRRFHSLPPSQVLLLVFLTGWAFCLGQAENSGASVLWQKVDEGFEVSSPQFEGTPYQTLIRTQILRVSLEKFQVRVLDSRSFGMIRMEIKTLVKRAQALAGVNGGFFLPDYKPLGLLIVDGREANPVRKADWGIFLIQENHPRIIHTKEFHNEKSVSQALQVGPRLVISGRELQLKKQVARRSALGITLRDEIILLNTQDTEAYAQDLAHIFRLPQSEGGLECRDAIALDGGPSAQMYGEYKGWRVDVPGGWAVPNGIGVFKR
jgi:uncharacterized protein YigE (DUF2233 family)